MLKLDSLADRSGVDAFLKQGGLEHTAIDILGILVYWVLMLIVILIALNGMGLQTASDLLNKIILYIPNVIVAVFVLIIGLFLARLLEGILLTYLKNTGVENARTISEIGRYAVIVLVVSATLDQLNIGKELVVSTVQIAFGALCLALALAFGLGGRDGQPGSLGNSSLRKGKGETNHIVC